MMAPFVVGSASAAAGEKARGVLAIPGTGVEMPLTVVHGARDGPTVLVTAGVHGGEYPCIEAAIRTARDLDPARVAGRIAIIHLYGVSAFHARQQYLTPEDGKNPNRVFPGRATGTVSERMAAAVMALAASADAWIDLHGGDVHEALVPFVICSEAGPPAVAAKARAMADAFGIPHVIVSSSVGGGTYAAAAAQGIPAILAEAGGQGVLDEASVAVLASGVRRVLGHLGVLPEPPPSPAPVEVFRRFVWVRAEHRGCWYPGVRAGDRVVDGQLLGVIRDYWGDPLVEHRAPAAGLVLFVVTSLAINPSDPLVGIGAA